ncbi:MAG: penicillin-binding transpeptidase domain-containing protein [Candidatus Adlerbacteria bacterium]|nr:penicillin-binding transpeptidase domain-containing protein [Candidatus Adlerbacteria bacterium]
MQFFRRGRKKTLRSEIHPDEILIDSSSGAEFNRDQFEGRIEQPLSRRSFFLASGLVALLLLAYVVRAADLQLAHGAAYAEQAKNNQLTEQTIFADRGIIADRNGIPLAFNEPGSVADDFAKRTYANFAGLAHAVGYVKAPAKDSYGVYYRNAFVGIDGAEKAFNAQLAGRNGLKLSETDAKGKIISESVVQPPQAGETLTLSLDAKVTEGLYKAISARVDSSKFQGGAGVIIDVTTGEILAMTSYPEYSQNGVENGDAAVLKSLNADTRQPFLNRATDGLYAPGSIVKPVMGLAALQEGIISETKQILSTGSISVPNPYDPAHPSIFKDWRANGWVDVQQAIAVSSDVYFYAVGGGYKDQAGLGIDRIDKYLRLFGFGQDAGLAGFSEQDGNIPTIAWKVVAFPKDPTWRLGDTYHTAIGQYGMQVTPLQAVREAAAVANGGTLLTPTLTASSTPAGTKIHIDPHNFDVVQEGMRMGVTTGIAQSVKFDFVHVAAKTGTAQIGTHNQYLNSWMIGFFPYEHPKYAYAVVLERGPAGTLQGAPAVMAAFLPWMNENAPQYLK